MRLSRHPICPRCGGLRFRRDAGIAGFHRACCCPSGTCATIARGDFYIPPFGERCTYLTSSGFNNRKVNSLEVELKGIDGNKCFTCAKSPFFNDLWNEIVEISGFDGVYNVPADPNEPCDFRLASIGTVHVRKWDQATTCGDGTKIADYNGPAELTIINGLLDIFVRDFVSGLFTDAFVFSTSGQGGDAVFTEGCGGTKFTADNNLACNPGDLSRLSSSGTAEYRAGADAGFKTSVPNPFPLDAAEWSDLEDGTDCPIKDLMRIYDFGLILEGKLSNGSNVKVDVEVEVVASTTIGLWSAGTATIPGGSTNLTILDQEMKWTSNGWQFRFKFRDETDSSVHELTMLRDTQSPAFCSHCWGSIVQFEDGWRITNVSIAEGC